MGRRGSAARDDASGPAGAGPAFEFAHAGTLQFFPELVAELGADPHELLRHAGIEPAELARYAPRLNYRAMIDLLEQAAVRLQRPDFGMLLARRQGGGQVFGPIGVVMRNSGTFGDALQYVSGHIQAYSLATSLPIDRDRASNRVFVGMDILLDGVPNRSQTMEQIMLLAHLNAMEITKGRARVREIRFRHQPVSPPRSYREYFGCDVRFDQPADCLVYTQEDMDAPVVDPDAQHYEMATFFIDTNFPATAAPMHARVRGLVMKLLGMSDCRIERIADDLCLHPRTLHRRLKWENTSFEDIKDEVRRDVALYYLEQTDIPFTRIAEKLGYSETSVLSRSCLRWFGASPRDMRLRLRGDAARERHLAGQA